MSFAKHIGQPPPFDAAAAAKAPTGKAWEKFAPWKRWLGGEGEFDGKGLRDVVEANAQALDQLKRNVDDNAENNGVAHNSFNQRLAALEAQAATGPFPLGSG